MRVHDLDLVYVHVNRGKTTSNIVHEFTANHQTAVQETIVCVGDTSLNRILNRHDPVIGISSFNGGEDPRNRATLDRNRGCAKFLDQGAVRECARWTQVGDASRSVN